MARGLANLNNIVGARQEVQQEVVQQPVVKQEEIVKEVVQTPVQPTPVVEVPVAPPVPNVEEKVEEIKETIIPKNDSPENNSNTIIGKEVDKLSEMREKYKNSKSKAENKQITIYLTPKNLKRFNALTGNSKGAKSNLINDLLDMYFGD